MKVRSLLCLGVLVVLSAALVSGQQNHFKVYPVRAGTQFAPIGVNLADQFVRQPRQVRLATLPFFANPVKKTHAGTGYAIGNPKAHLAWYKFEQPEMTGKRAVKFKNQFGEQRWELAEAVFLLVPTQKMESGATMPATPQQLRFNHFKAYTVTAGQISPIKVQLRDQFDTAPVSVEVQRPAFFCNPATKNTEAMVDSRYHLACYYIQGAVAPNVRAVDILNQFRRNRLYPTTPTMLCVPTEKLGFEPIR
jgi:hypothetical protein